MDAQGLMCDGIRADGAPCGEAAQVTSTRYIYQRMPDETGQLVEILRETHYDWQCPNCGPRKKVVRHD